VRYVRQRQGLVSGLIATAGALAVAAALFELPAPAGAQTAPTPADHQQFLTRYCQGCHNDRAKTGGLSLQPLKLDNHFLAQFTRPQKHDFDGGGRKRGAEFHDIHPAGFLSNGRMARAIVASS